MKSTTKRAMWAALLGIVAVFVAGALAMASTKSIWSPDCGARLIQVRSILEHGPAWYVSTPSDALDPERRNSYLYFFEFNHDGRTYVFYSFLFAQIATLCYKALGFPGLTLISAIAGAAAAGMTGGIARHLGLRFPFAPMLIVALATPLAIYSVLFWDHSLTTAITTAALLLALRAIATRRSGLFFAAGAALGAGLWFHEIIAPFVPALLLGIAWTFRRDRPALLRFGLLVVAGVVALVVPLAVINKGVYGTVFGPHLSNNRLGSPGDIARFVLSPREWGPGALYTLFAWGDTNPAFTWQLNDWLRLPSDAFAAELRVSAILAIPTIAWLALGPTGLWQRRWTWPLALLTIFGAVGAAVWMTTNWALPHGLFLTSPILLLALAAGPRDKKASDGDGDARPVVAVVTIAYAALTLIKPSLGGTEWGPRHLLAIVPCLSVLAWANIERILPRGRFEPGPLASRLLTAGVALLALASVGIQAHGFRVVYGGQERNRELARAIAASPDDVIVSAVWWAPLNATTLGDPASGKQILFAGDPEHPATALFERMRARGIRSYTLIGFSAWNLSDFSRPYGYAPVPGSDRPTEFSLWTARYAVPDGVP